MSESDLVRQAQRGDQGAFRRLVETYALLTERTARVLLADRRDAEDAVQEAWLDAWRSLERVHPERPFRPWILTLTANRCRMSARKKAPIAVAYDPALDGTGGSLQIAPPLIAGEAHDPELARALTGLNEEQRQVVALRYYAELELEEIAVLTGAPLGTVKSRLHRALESLRSRMAARAPALEMREGQSHG
jgi:RNA polymerase sigma-70 factor (ECF subfamily)